MAQNVPLVQLIRSGSDDLSDLLPALIESFILDVQAANRSPNTVKFYRWGLSHWHWWAEREGLAFPDACRPDAVRRFTSYLQTTNERWDSDWHSSRRKLSPATIHGYHRALKAFCSYLVAEGELEASPFTRLKTYKMPQKQLTPLTDAELKALLAACRDTANGERDTAIILLILDTGLRVSELLQMRLQNVTRTGSITIMGKGSKERTVTMGVTARRALLRYVTRRTDRSHSLWMGAQGPLGVEGVESMLRRRSKQAGIRHVHPHLLRHSFAVRFLKAGGDAFSLMRILGHTSIDITRRYVNYTQDDLTEVQRRFSPADRLSL